MDSLTAHHLARELDSRWRGRRVRACVLDQAQRSVFLAVQGSAAVVIDLSSPQTRVREAGPAEGAQMLERGGALAGWTVRAVHAPLDDRRLVVELARAGRFKGSAEGSSTLVVSVVPTARGAVVRNAGGGRVAAIGSRIPSAVEPRPLLDATAVESAARSGDTELLLTGRWVSPIVARWLCSDPELAAERYQLLAADEAAWPAWCGSQLVPFPMCANAEPAPSLIAPAEAGPGPEAPIPEERVDDRVERARRRMSAELERAREAPRLRAIADALVLLGDAAAPPTVALPDGACQEVPAKPGDSARDVAERLYGRARAMERALEILPGRIAALAGGSRRERGVRSGGPTARAAAPARAFRSYRSSSGLEIRVGKGAASNDALTFRESAPDDVWLHARASAGAHVVLRWRGRDAPPARALEEAAALAAWYSKARGSTLVPVDWTRRKYVRKARGGAPGAVIVQRAETVMVRPDAALEKRLRDW